MKINIIFMMFILTLCSVYASDTQPKFSKENAIKILKDGNDRFVTGKRTFSHIDAARIKDTAENGQHPFTIILTCSDSRVPPEHIFDVGIGDVFVIRDAGNVAGVDEIATIEYGTEHLKTPLVVVMGHTRCGAVTAAANDTELEGNLPLLIEKIKPAAKRVKSKEPGLKDRNLVDTCAVENVWVSIEDMLNKSKIIRELAKEGRVMIVGALYDIDTGKVKWLGQHPEEKKLTEKK